MIVAIETAYGVVAKEYALAVRQRLKENKGIFTSSGLKMFSSKGKMLTVMEIQPTLPKIFIFGGLLYVGAELAHFFWGWSQLWTIPGLVLIASVVFWMRAFYGLVYAAGLKKAGYKGTVKILDGGEIAARLFEEVQ